MKKTRIGIFGLWRGGSFCRTVSGYENAEVVALCDSSKKLLDDAVKACPGPVKAFSDFDSFINSGMDAVMLFNYFPEHAKYAIKAMEKGIHVYSECTSGATMRDCVLLCEAVEKTGCKYMLGENYPFSAPLLEMEKLVKGGTLGRILYAEGEYNHACTREDLKSLTPGKYHWRAFLPRSYYVTHALGPLMHITKRMPVKVNAFAVHSDVLEQYNDFRHNYDALAMMNCITDDGSLFRVTGCAAMASGSGYRICGEFGGAETGRTLGSNLHLGYHSWTVPAGKQADQTYTPTWDTNAELAAKAGHGGGDFWTVYNFVRYLREDVAPFFNVYRGCAMSAVGILGWRSCLENGRTYDIPDFTNVAERNKYRDDALTPFPDENGFATLPCATKAAKNGSFKMQY